MQLLKPGGQRKRNQDGNDDPRVMKPNLDAKDAAQVDL
jgi:hypothetical protein